MRRWRSPLAAVLVATRTEQEAAKLAAAPPETGAQPSADIYAPEPAAAARRCARSSSAISAANAR